MKRESRRGNQDTSKGETFLMIHENKMIRKRDRL